MNYLHHRHLLGVILIVATALLGLAATALAAPVHRPLQANGIVGGSCGATIQACLDAAAPGDRVLIPAGTYVEHLYLRKGVSLIGAGANVTIIRSDAANWKTLSISAQTAPITASTVISGLTFTGGNSSTAGGGIGMQYPMSPTIQNVIVPATRPVQVAGLEFPRAPRRCWSTS